MIKWINLTSQFHQIKHNWTKSPNWVVSSPRNSNFSQNTKLIKFKHKDHFYSVHNKNPLINFQRKGLNYQKSQICIGSKITQQCMNLCMKIENKWKRKGNKVLPALEEKNLAKFWRKTTKKFPLNPWLIEEREKSFWKFWNSVWTHEKQSFLKNLYMIFDWSKIRFDRSKITFDWSNSDRVGSDSKQNFNRIFDRSRNRFDRSKI